MIKKKMCSFIVKKKKCVHLCMRIMLINVPLRRRKKKLILKIVFFFNFKNLTTQFLSITKEQSLKDSLINIFKHWLARSLK